MARMHPRNRYFHKAADFWELAEFRPSLKPYLLLKERHRKDRRQADNEAPPTEDMDGPQHTVSGDPIPTPDDPSAPIPTPDDPSAPIPTPSASIPTPDDHAAPIPAPDDPSGPIPTPDDPSVPILTPDNPSAPIPAPGDPSVPPSGVHGNKRFLYTLDFSNPEAVRELTYAVLERDFGLHLEIPEDCLVPTVPQKLNYIHWVEDLLCCGELSEEEGVMERTIPKGKSTVGIDIGTGMSCIYPLLGSKLNSWSFIATDITPATVQYATANVARNGLQDYIKVELVTEGSMLKEVVDSPSSTQYAFTMCNPPFFKSKEEQQSGCARSRPLPATFSQGAEKETVTEGGEVGFVKRMIQDSLVLRDKVRWYTTMLGKKSSLKELKSELTSCQVPVVTKTEFVQGKTWRWGLAWSFDETLKDKVTMTKRKRKQSHIGLQFRVMGGNGRAPSPTSAGVHGVKKWLKEELDQLGVAVTMEPCESCDTSGESHVCIEVKMKCFSERAMWSNPRRVRRLRERLNFHNQSSAIQDMTEDQRQLMESSLAELKQNLQAELNSLCGVCNMDFTVCIKLQEESLSGQISLKRRKMVARRQWRKKKAGNAEANKGPHEGEEGRNGMGDDKEGGGKCVCVELEWISGCQETDYLHQLLQYLQNQMSTSTVDFH